MMQRKPVKISVIVPVHNGAEYLRRSLDALISSSRKPHEIIVVDDASTDGSVEEARRRGVKVVRLEKNSGPAAARNAGAAVATGNVFFFVDSDVVVRKDTLLRVEKFFEAPGRAAIFGSYDDEPADPGFVSQYRNLLHHYHHQRASSDAFSFWAGCGAIRRGVFEAAGGFDASRYSVPSMEDIELGWRIKRLGYAITLDRDLLVKHLKGWGFVSMVKTDVMRRAVPWSRLILETGSMPVDLNLKRTEKISAVIVMLLIVLFFIIAAGGARLPAVLFAGLLVAFFALNRPLYSFYSRKRGVLFALKTVPLHMLYYVYSGTAFVYCWLERKTQGRAA